MLLLFGVLCCLCNLPALVVCADVLVVCVFCFFLLLSSAFCCFCGLLFGSPTVEPPPWPLLTFQNVNNNFTIYETPLTSENVKNNFLYPEQIILYPEKRSFCFNKKSLWSFVSQKKTFVPKKSHPSRYDSEQHMLGDTTLWTTRKDWTGRDLGLANSTEGTLLAHGSKWVSNRAMAATLVHALDVWEETDQLRC